jgi:hypothetical protein
VVANGPIGQPKSTMTLSICSGNAPSSTIRFISVPNGPRLRLATNPSQLPAIALILAILRPKTIAVASVSGALFAPFTTSNSFMTLAGAKKCVPQTSCGRSSAAEEFVQ